MHHAFNKENIKTHHTLPFYKIHASHINFGPNYNHASLVNPLPISYKVIISGCTTVNTYHATKLMGNDQCHNYYYYLEQKITYNTNTTQNTTLTLPRIIIYTKTVTIVAKLLGTFLVILTLTIWEDVTTLSPFFKAAVSFTINISFGTTLASIGQLSAVRMLDIHIKFVHFKFYPWTFQEVPKTTPATVPETLVTD